MFPTLRMVPGKVPCLRHPLILEGVRVLYEYLERGRIGEQNNLFSSMGSTVLIVDSIEPPALGWPRVRSVALAKGLRACSG